MNLPIYCGGFVPGAAGGAVFHVPQPLIANRYHAQNATWGDLTGVSSEMRVIAAKPTFELLAHNKLDDDKSAFNGSPAVSGGRLFLRSDTYLYCIEKK